ncbi:hypothetical protein C1I95_17605 [Micromonospora craterilacus]|uniref:Uncharacterized protein n=1 Tax=Micromonospora craterilacus TaxID=1655439 RepID=A0A2W2EVK2_9ACTN|nr:hypothetical protein [Micromonospora craterilacus]PZG16488.1 hypothetical protein C1I95_17605 [Micromonospora craterilacus]
MSRFYFHSPSGDAEILGSEWAWLDCIARGPADAAWDLDPYRGGYDRAKAILAMSPKTSVGLYGGNGDLHRMLREATARPTDYEARRRLVQAIRLWLRVDGLDLNVAGVRLHTP